MGFLVRRFRPKPRVVGDPGEPAFDANWSSTTGLRFFLDAEGQVHVGGRATNSVDPAPSRIFVLPEGFRPSAEVRVAGISGLSGAAVSVAANGDVTMESGNPADTLFVSFAFRAA